jgi:hypothetical protein
MTDLDLYGIGALALIGVVFWRVRRISTYLAISAAIIASFAFVISTSPTTETLLTPVLMIVGLVECGFGLLVVRVMLVRSVSLRLLGRDAKRTDAFHDDIHGRLHDMRRFHLVRTDRDGNTLTGFGQFVSGIVAASYSLFRIDE